MISSTRSHQEETITSRRSLEKNCTDTSDDDHFSTIPGESESSGSSHGLTSQISIRLRITAGCVTESLVRSVLVTVEEEKCRRKCRQQEWWWWWCGPAAVPLPKVSLSCRGGRDLDPTDRLVLEVEELVAGWLREGQAICHDAVQLGTSCQAASLSPKKELASRIECSHAGVSYFCRIISGEKKRKRWWFRNGNLRIFRLARRQSKQGTRE